MTELSNRDQTAIQRLRDLFFILQEPVKTSRTELINLTKVTNNYLQILIDQRMIKTSQDIFVWDSIEPSLHMLKEIRKVQKDRWFSKEEAEELGEIVSIFGDKNEEDVCHVQTSEEFYLIKVRKDHLPLLSTYVLMHDAKTRNELHLNAHN